MGLKHFIYIVFFMFGCGMAQAQVSFDAKVSKTRLGINERLRIDFQMNQDGDNFNPPNFDGFRVVGGPNQSVSNSWINGKEAIQKLILIFYLLKPEGKS